MSDGEDPATSDPSATSGTSDGLVYWWAPRGDERVFDLVSWPPDALHVVRSLLEGAELEHRWEAGKLVVAAAQRQEVQELLDEVVAASRPRLEEDADRVAYELADWPADQLRELEAALDREGILAEWTEEGELLVYEIDEERVDALFEELDLHGPDERICAGGRGADRACSTTSSWPRTGWSGTPGTRTRSWAPSPLPARWRASPRRSASTSGPGSSCRPSSAELPTCWSARTPMPVTRR